MNIKVENKKNVRNNTRIPYFGRSKVNMKSTPKDTGSSENPQEPRIGQDEDKDSVDI